MDSTKAPPTIRVTVTFPIASQPYSDDAVSPDATVGSIRGAAMTAFGIANDPGATYYLTARGEQQPDERTIGEIAGPARAVQLRLIKQIIQG